MTDAELSLALTILRAVRGWKQDDLAKASGIPNSSISDYERGKKVPSLKTLDRLVAAMGYTIIALQRTVRFVSTIRTEGILETMEWPAGEQPEAPEESTAPDAVGGASPAALQWELEQISTEAGRVVNRLTRVVLILMSRGGAAPP